MIGEITEELSGQVVDIAGVVTQASHLTTKSGRPFAKAILEDLSGTIEVAAWARVYQETKDFWKEGQVLLVKGKVNMRDDKPQLNCDSAAPFQPAALAPEGAKMSDEPKRANGYPNGSAGNGNTRPANGDTRRTDATPLNTNPQPPKPAPARRPARRLTIKMMQTFDEESDVKMLHKIVDTLKEFPGEDHVRLLITNDGDVVNLKLGNITINYDKPLHDRLAILVGESGLTLETANGNTGA
jgi:DNA polymerase-3 subunit alpha